MLKVIQIARDMYGYFKERALIETVYAVDYVMLST